MKILIYGAGVVGCTYGWQLSQAGCDVTVCVEGKKQFLAVPRRSHEKTILNRYFCLSEEKEKALKSLNFRALL